MFWLFIKIIVTTFNQMIHLISQFNRKYEIQQDEKMVNINKDTKKTKGKFNFEQNRNSKKTNLEFFFLQKVSELFLCLWNQIMPLVSQ